MKNLLILLTFLLITLKGFALTGAEEQRIKVYKNVADSVVNVTNVKLARNFFYGTVDIPQGAGTGFVWDKEGHIVTNFHVIHGGNRFYITFRNDKKQYEAKVVAKAPESDIAVLKLVEIPKNLNPIEVGDSTKLQVGQSAMAIGNPFGLDHSLTSGVISALKRKIVGIAGNEISDMIQTDAAINQGNSGGPLVDSDGKLIGMNTMIYSPSGGSAGLGFAVPVDTIKTTVPDLIKFKKVIRPWLGIGIIDGERKEFYINLSGVLIADIADNGPASKSGLRGFERDRYGKMIIGDLITSLAGKKVNSFQDLHNILGKHKIGDNVELKYWRDGKEKKTTLTLEARETANR